MKDCKFPKTTVKYNKDAIFCTMWADKENRVDDPEKKSKHIQTQA
jgi:hypothetical protein